MLALKLILKFVFAFAFIFGGVWHFVKPKLYTSIMPSYLPWHLALVYLSGVAEVVLGLGLLFPVTQIWSAWGLILLLVAIFPANLHMALNPKKFHKVSPVFLRLRLPLQLVLIAWAWWFTWL